MKPGADGVVRAQLEALLPRVRRFAYGLTGSMDEGDDLLQATYERAIRGLDKWQPGSRLDSWMFRIAQNLHYNRLRDARTRGRHIRPIITDDQANCDGVQAMESRMTMDSVRRFIARLPEEQRTVLLLICVEGMSYQEVSENLDLPIGTVTSRLARARIRLREYMSGEASQPPMLLRKVHP